MAQRKGPIGLRFSRLSAPYKEANRLNDCYQPSDEDVREMIYQTWIDPIIATRCDSHPELQ